MTLRTGARNRTAGRILGVLALGFVMAIFAWWPMLAAFPNTQGGDGPPYHKTIEAARVSVVRYHELPLWNPYECGGLPLWDNPQGPPAAPLMWTTLFLGTTASMYLWYLLHSAIGFLSMWLFARDEVKLSRAATFVASLAWAFSGFHQQHYSGGHFTFVPFLYFPFAVLLWRRAAGDLRYAVGLGWLVAWMMLEGAVYPLPHLVVLLGAETLTRLKKQTLVPIVKAGAIVGLVGFLVGACRFLPVIDQLKSHTRPIGIERDHIQWATLRDMFVSRTHERGVAGQTYVWPEYGTYIGPFLLVLAAIGAIVCAFESPWLVALAVVCFVLMMGHFSPVAPWAVLKAHVYPFKEMRVPSRFRCEVSMFLAVFAGIAVDRLPQKLAGFSRKAGKIGRTLALAIAFIGAGDMIATGIAWFTVCFNNPPEQKVAVSPRLYVHGPNLSGMIDQPRQNRIRLACWDEWGFSAGAPMWEGDVPQAVAAPGAKVVVTNVVRTQNKFSFHVEAEAPGRVLVNSGYDRGFRSNVGTVGEENKLLVLDVPQGSHDVRMEYWPHGLTLGFFLSFVGLAGSIAGFVKLGKAARTKPSSTPATRETKRTEAAARSSVDDDAATRDPSKHDAATHDPSKHDAATRDPSKDDAEA